MIGVAKDRYTIAISDQVPDAVAAELRGIVEGQPANADDPATPPVAMPHCAELLAAALGPVEVSSGPSYVVPGGTRFESQLTIHLSTDESSHLRESDTRWVRLASRRVGRPARGKLGPWAMATIEESRGLDLPHAAPGRAGRGGGNVDASGSPRTRIRCGDDGGVGVVAGR